MAVQTTYTEARKRLATLLSCASDDRETVIISRRNHSDVALIAADELRSLEETAHLLRSPANARRLLEALQRSLSADVRPEALDDLRAEVGLTEESVGPAQ